MTERRRDMKAKFTVVSSGNSLTGIDKCIGHCSFSEFFINCTTFVVRLLLSPKCNVLQHLLLGQGVETASAKFPSPYSVY